MIAFLLIVGSSFYVIATMLIGVVSESLFNEKVAQETANVQAMAVEYAPYFTRGDTAALLEKTRNAVNKRVLLLDMDAKVQVDTFSLFNGYRFQHPEVIDIINGKDVSSGFHMIRNEGEVESRAIFDFVRNLNTGKTWAAYFTAVMVSGDERVGVVMYSVGVQDMVDQLRVLQDQMLLWFFVVAVAVLFLTLLFSQIITKPVAALAEGINRMGRGDFSARVKASGIDEMGRLAETFNQMSERLENMDSIRNEFISNASHELKTPLATMKIMLESMLYQEEMPLELRTEFLTDINRELDRLSGIVTDLLTLVQADAYDYRLMPEHFLLKELVADTVHRLEPLAKEKRQTLAIKAAGDCAIYADPGKIQQAIYNLIDNAIKYSPEGGHVTIVLRHEGKLAVLEISDDGPGIPKKDQPHIFDRFYRVDRARARATGGNGLGLSIVHQIVLLHEGSVTVRSEEGKGSTFRVELPMP